MSNNEDDDDTAPQFLEMRMDGQLLVMNILLQALRRSATLSLGYSIDGEPEPGEDKEVPAMMLKLALQGLKDCIGTCNFLPLSAFQRFASDVADELVKDRAASVPAKKSSKKRPP